jgi:hypothetical protein
VPGLNSQGAIPTGRLALRRLASPSCLWLALLMFPLPWVEIQCERNPPTSSPPGTLEGLFEVESIRRQLPGREAETMATQSGLQAALGTCTTMAQGNEAAEKERELAEAMSPSPLMMVWPVVVVAGAVAGFVLPNGQRRLLAIGVCAAAALLMLLAQIVIGFPIAALAKDPPDRQPPEPEQVQNSSQFDRFTMYATYTPWFILVVMLTGGALVMTAVDWRRSRCEPDPPVASP